MEASGKSLAAQRVVVLTREAALAIAAGRGGRVRCIRVESPYQAAAEILAGPTAALVVDFRLLTRRHLRLLRLARELDVQLVAVGTLPINISSDELSGVQLFGRDDLPAALARIASQAAAATSAKPVKPVKLTPAKKPKHKAKKRKAAGKPTAESATGQANGLDELLTSEELTSLLEDQP